MQLTVGNIVRFQINNVCRNQLIALIDQDQTIDHALNKTAVSCHSKPTLRLHFDREFAFIDARLSQRREGTKVV